jgi:hypothetical protein
MKILGVIARMALARAARSIEPVEEVTPFNWMIRNVRACANKWASSDSL